jgi:hypothetical protein
VPQHVVEEQIWGRCGAHILCENLTPSGVHCGTPAGSRWRGGGFGRGVCAWPLTPQRRVGGSPPIIAPGQKERFLFGLKVLAFPAEVQVRVSRSETTVGMSDGNGRAPSAGSFFTVERRRVAAKERGFEARCRPRRPRPRVVSHWALDPGQLVSGKVM